MLTKTYKNGNIINNKRHLSLTKNQAVKGGKEMEVKKGSGYYACQVKRIFDDKFGISKGSQLSAESLIKFGWARALNDEVVLQNPKGERHIVSDEGIIPELYVRVKNKSYMDGARSFGETIEGVSNLQKQQTQVTVLQDYEDEIDEPSK